MNQSDLLGLAAAARRAIDGRRGDFVDVCTPELVLELIADREKLRWDLTSAYLRIAGAQRDVEGLLRVLEGK